MSLIANLLKLLHRKFLDYRESTRIYNWLKGNTSNKAGEQFRSTREIASWNNLTEDRVRYLCSVHKKIFLSTSGKEDMWGIYSREPKSVYEERGIISV